jgi:hypothetical protein
MTARVAAPAVAIEQEGQQFTLALDSVFHGLIPIR